MYFPASQFSSGIVAFLILVSTPAIRTNATPTPVGISLGGKLGVFPRNPIDYSAVPIDLARELYNTYDGHASGGSNGIEARPNTNRNIPPPQNQNEKISRNGQGSGSTGALNTAEQSRVNRPGEGNAARPNTAAPSGSAVRSNTTPALGTVQINSGLFGYRPRGPSAAAPSAEA